MGKSLQVNIIGNASSYTRALSAATHANTGFGSSMAKVAKVALLSAGTAGIGAIAVGLKVGVSEWIQSAKVAAQTGAVIKSTGGIANVTARDVDTLGTSIMKMSGIDDEAIKTGENMLLTFGRIRNEAGKGNDIFNQATLAVTDMDVAMTHGNSTAESLAKTSILVGKALNDPIKGSTALRRVGVQLTDQQTEQIKAFVKSGDVMAAQKIILGELRTEFAGSAKAMGDTLPGKINILKESFKNMSAELISKAIPTFQRLISFLTSHMPEIQAAASRAFTAVGAVIGQAVSVIQRHWGTIIGVGKTLITVLTTIGNFLRTDIGQAFAIAAIGMVGLVKAINAVRTAMLLLGGATPALAAIGLAMTAIAFIALKFTGAKHNVDLLANAFKALEQTVRGAKAALDEIEQTDLSVQSAKLRVTETLHAEQAAWKNLNAVRRDGKATTLEVKQAEDAYNRSVLDHKQALVDQGTATKAAATANKELTTSFVDQVTKLQGTIGKGQEFVAQLQKWGVETGKQELVQGRINKVLAETTATLSTGASAMTSYALKTGAVPTAANLAAIKVRDLDLATKEFITTHGRLPTKTELAIIIKKVETRNFAAELASIRTTAQSTAKAASEAFHGAIQGVPKAAGTAAKAAVTAVSSQAGAARSAGAGVGAAIGAGVSSGIDYAVRGVVASAEALVRAAISGAERAAQVHSPSKATIPIGKGLGEGISAGLVASAAQIGAAASKVVEKAVSTMTTAIAKGVPRISNGLSLLGPSLVKSVTAALKKVEPAAVKGMNDVGQMIVNAAKKYGIDAKAALAVAMTEGGIKFGARGDNDHSFGPFQMADFGALAHLSTAAAEKFANSVEGVNYALRKMKETGAGGLTGLAAIKQIIGGPGWGFERPADSANSVRKAIGYYKEIGPQTVSAIKSAGPAITGTLKTVLTGLVSLAQQYGPTIGIEQVRGIIKGLDASKPGFLAAANKAMAEAQTTMRTKILEGAATVGDAFGQMADRALAKFDEKVATWKNPLTAKITAMQTENAAKGGAESLAGAMGKIVGGDALATQNLANSLGKTLSEAMGKAMGQIVGAKTQQALTAAAGTASQQMTAAINSAAAPALAQADAQVTAAQAALAAAQATGDAEAITKAQTELDTAVANRAALGAAVRAEIERTTGVLAGAVDTQHATIAGRDRAGLAKQLTQLGTELAKHPGQWSKMGAEVNKTLASYNIRLQTAGKTWAEKFAAGISSGKSFVTTAVRDLVNAALAQVHQSPPKEGPLAGGTVERAGTLLAKEYAKGIASASGLVSSAMTGMLNGGLSMPAVATPRGSLALAAAPMGGTTELHFHVAGSVVTENELVDVVKRGLLRDAGRNVTGGF